MHHSPTVPFTSVNLILTFHLNSPEETNINFLKNGLSVIVLLAFFRVILVKIKLMIIIISDDNQLHYQHHHHHRM